MYITDAKHFLDDKGAIAPVRGPAEALADFHAAVIADVTDVDGSGLSIPRCFKCKKGHVEAALAADDAIVWHCPRCGVDGRNSNWQGTLWNLRQRPGAKSRFRLLTRWVSNVADSFLTSVAILSA